MWMCGHLRWVLAEFTVMSNWEKRVATSTSSWAGSWKRTSRLSPPIKHVSATAGKLGSQWKRLVSSQLFPFTLVRLVPTTYLERKEVWRNETTPTWIEAENEAHNMCSKTIKTSSSLPQMIEINAELKEMSGLMMPHRYVPEFRNLCRAWRYEEDEEEEEEKAFSFDLNIAREFGYSIQAPSKQAPPSTHIKSSKICRFVATSSHTSMKSFIAKLDGRAKSCEHGVVICMFLKSGVRSWYLSSLKMVFVLCMLLNMRCLFLVCLCRTRMTAFFLGLFLEDIGVCSLYGLEDGIFVLCIFINMMMFVHFMFWRWSLFFACSWRWLHGVGSLFCAWCRWWCLSFACSWRWWSDFYTHSQRLYLFFACSWRWWSGLYSHSWRWCLFVLCLFMRKMVFVCSLLVHEEDGVCLFFACSWGRWCLLVLCMFMKMMVFVLTPICNYA